MVKGLVSVIIPTYNREKLLLEAIASVRAQTYPSKEIIVVDDGSTDRTRQQVDALEGVRYISQERQGPAAARTLGLGVARGEFIAPLDSDDLWNADFLDRCVESLTEFSLDFVFANWVQVPNQPSYLSRWERQGRLEQFSGGRRGEWWLLNPAQVREIFLDTCLAPSSSLVLRRSSMPSHWNTRMQVADDWYLILEMILMQPCHAAFTTTPLWLKRTDGSNRYDGQPFRHVLRRLYHHDVSHFRRDFGDRLSQREQAKLAVRQLGLRAVLAQVRGALDSLIFSREHLPGTRWSRHN